MLLQLNPIVVTIYDHEDNYLSLVDWCIDRCKYEYCKDMETGCNFGYHFKMSQDTFHQFVNRFNLHDYWNIGD